MIARLVGPVLLLVFACNAPHDNPFDPALGGNVEGRILTRRATGIGSAEVSVPAAARSAWTDSTGAFYLSGLPAESVWVFCRADSYAVDSARLGLAKGRVDTLSRYLNGLPNVLDCGMSSHVYGRSWPPRPLYFCRLFALVGDMDGEADIESVWVEFQDLGGTRRFSYDADKRRFSLTIWADSLPGFSLETLVGRQADIRVVDREGAVTRCPGHSLSRIIADLPCQAFPAGGLDTVWADTTFAWHRFAGGFWVSYYCEVVRVEGGGPAGLAASFSTSGPDDTVYRFSAALLAPGDYYWTVEAIDAQGNSARSKEELFHAR
jgi:hypothetical protein